MCFAKDKLPMGNKEGKIFKNIRQQFHNSFKTLSYRASLVSYLKLVFA